MPRELASPSDGPPPEGGGDAIQADVPFLDVMAGRMFHLAYQPLVNLRNNRILGYEALLRCNVRGFEYPPDMIAAAIAAGRVGELGRSLRRMATEGCPDSPLFLNIIPQEFGIGLLLDPGDPIFTHRNQVYIEITESVPVHYYELCHDTLTAARAQGVRLAVDDFGAGYSNLQYIADLEPDIVKLDRGLIAGLTLEGRRFRLVKNVVRLCLDMGAEVVAEGIETSDEHAACMEAGVHYGQGFWLARPAVIPPQVDATPPPVLREQHSYRVLAQPARIHCVENPELRRFLDRRRRFGDTPHEVDLNAVLTNILEKANAFVPSAAGTIFLDDPLPKTADDGNTELVFVACFGERAGAVLGARMPAKKGIVGWVYSTGRAYLSADPEHDQFFYRGIDEKTNYKTESVICVPLRLENVVIGAIQLLNRLGDADYDENDLALLEIFAQAVSSSVVNAVDAQRAVDLAKRDDLSGLFNDRFLHLRLLEVVRQSLAHGADCGVLFIDLDHFKRINDTRGHLIGSALLREVGILLRRLIAPTAIAARYGGDEFVIVCPDTDRHAVLESAERVRRGLEEHVFLATADPYDPAAFPALSIRGEVTCSIGVATLRQDVQPRHGPLANEPTEVKTRLLELSDRALYHAKVQGRNRVSEVV